MWAGEAGRGARPRALFFSRWFCNYFRGRFNGCNFPIIFTGGHKFSRVVAEIFSLVVFCFQGRKTRIFHRKPYFFDGKKHWELLTSRHFKFNSNFKTILQTDTYLEVNRKCRCRADFSREQKIIKSNPWHFFVTRENFRTSNPWKFGVTRKNF